MRVFVLFMCLRAQEVIVGEFLRACLKRYSQTWTPTAASNVRKFKQRLFFNTLLHNYLATVVKLALLCNNGTCQTDLSFVLLHGTVLSLETIAVESYNQLCQF